MNRFHFSLIKIWIVVATMTSGCGPDGVYPEAEIGETIHCLGANLSSEESPVSCDKFKTVARVSVLAYKYAFQSTPSDKFFYPVELHPDSNGYSWPPDAYQSDAGYTEVYGETHCPKAAYIAPRIVLASKNWDDRHARDVICHEYTHTALGCGMDDHERMNKVHLDQICAAAQYDPEATLKTYDLGIEPPALPKY